MEFISNLQSGFDPQKPSIFELLSEQQLSSLIPPSLRYLLLLATQRNPYYLLRLYNSFDEIYALLQLLIERHYLRTHSSSFTENFYSLKRERVLLTRTHASPRAQQASPSSIRSTLRLRARDVRLNLLLIVLLPYLKRKLDESYDIHIAPSQSTVLGPTFARADTLPPGATLRQRVLHYYKFFLRRIYPSLNAGYHFSTLAFSLAYLSSHTAYSSPFLWLIGSRIRRMGEADHAHAHYLSARGATTSLSPSRPLPGRPGQVTTSLMNPMTLANTVTPRLFGSLKILLPMSIFALKFLEWWHASDFGRQLARKAAEGVVLPAPLTAGLPSSSKMKAVEKSASTATAAEAEASEEKEQQERRGESKPPISATTYLPILTVPLPQEGKSELCPICLSAIQTPTACQTGVVYCYTCIFRWIQGEQERQGRFMDGGGEEADARGGGDTTAWKRLDGGETRRGKWEDGRGRDAVTGRRVLGGSDGLRRVRV